MKITTQGDYGLRCVLNIAQGNGNPVTIDEICQEEALSADYAEQLLLRLRRSGIVKSQKGPGGGYVLSKKPKSINVRDVILALENKPFETICEKLKKKKNFCGRSNNCKLKIIWNRINRETQNILKKVTLNQIT